MKKYYVYELINLMGTIEDVGESTTPKMRMYQHTKVKSREGISGVGKYYGRQDLIMNIVAEFDNRHDALKLEGELKLLYGIEWNESTRGIKGGKLAGKIAKESGQIYDLVDKLKKPIIVYKLDGSYVGEYNSGNECARQLNLSKGNISSVCKGKRKHTKGYTIKYKENA